MVRPRSLTARTPPAKASSRSHDGWWFDAHGSPVARNNACGPIGGTAFLTDLDGTVVEVDKFHRRHAVVELAIRDLKEGAGLEHVPSGNFHANSVWLQCAVSRTT